MAKEKKEPRQVFIKIQCDEGYCADTLRELATRIEDDLEYNFEIETEHAMIESTIEDE